MIDKLTLHIASALLLKLMLTDSRAAEEIAPSAPDTPIGFASLSGNTTGGGNATSVTVRTFAELQSAAQDTAPRVIVVVGAIKTDGGYGMKIAGNKTIRGADKNATIEGGLSINTVSNVILRNFNLKGIWPNPGPDDAIAIRNSHHVWIDHLNIWDAGGGNLDITSQSSHITISWCKFWYTKKRHPHRFCALIGSGGGDHPEDWGRLKVTYHHNWFADLVDQRMPRLMYGQAHIFNNYYTAAGNSYCIGVGSYGAALIENNYFKDVKNPHTFMYDVWCDITARGNFYKNTTGKRDAGRGGARHIKGQDFPLSPFDRPPYDYPLDKAEDIPALVTRNAGPQ